MIYVMLVNDSQSKKAPFRSSESKGKYWPKADLTCQAWAADYIGSANGVCVGVWCSKPRYLSEFQLHKHSIYIKVKKSQSGSIIGALVYPHQAQKLLSSQKSSRVSVRNSK